MNEDNWKGIIRLIIGTILLIFGMCVIAAAEEYSDEEICNAIWYAEGGEKTKYPYGIKSVKCEGENECRKICFNTVRNNRERFKIYRLAIFRKNGISSRPKDYIRFLASRYCPPSEYQCENWEKNVRYILKKNKYDYTF